MKNTIGTIPAHKMLGMEIDLLTKLRSGALSLQSFDSYLKGRNPFGMPDSIQLGRFENWDALRSALKDAECEASEHFVNLDSLKLIKKPLSLDLIVTSVKELGFTETTTRKEIYEKATSDEFRYRLLPAEVGPQLRLLYLDQPKEQVLNVAMRPVYGHGKSDKSTFIYFLEGLRRGKNSLCERTGFEDFLVEPHHLWVFQKPAKRKHD